MDDVPGREAGLRTPGVQSLCDDEDAASDPQAGHGSRHGRVDRDAEHADLADQIPLGIERGHDAVEAVPLLRNRDANREPRGTAEHVELHRPAATPHRHVGHELGEDRCRLSVQSNDDVATVTAFYESKLNTGAWQVTSSAGQGGKITFQPAKSATPFGTVQVLVSSTHTEITIDTFTATCLPLNFPKYPGARFAGMNKETGAISGCHAVFATNAGAAVVTAYYKSNLNSGRWRVTSSSENQVAWRLTNGKRTDASGTVRISANDAGTEIDVDAYP